MIDNKIDLLINKIMSEKENDDIKAVGVEQGNYPRDFGMDTWDWTQGVALYGLYNSKQHTHLDVDLYIKKWFESKFDEDHLKNINTACPLLTLTLINEGEYDEFINNWIEWAVNDLPKTKHDLFQHTTSNVDGSAIQLNDGQIWADTLFMTNLFVMNFGIKTQNNQLIELSKYQMLMHVEYLFDRNDKLFYHGYDFINQNNFGEIYWGRGNGWMYYALAISFELLEGYNDACIKYLKEIFVDACESMLYYQNENGLWNTIVNAESYNEISASALIATSFLKGYKLGLLPEKYKDAALVTVNEAISNICDDGSVEQVSAGTSIGYDAKHYRDIIKKDMPYGKSLVLLLLLEYKGIGENYESL